MSELLHESRVLSALLTRLCHYLLRLRGCRTRSATEALAVNSERNPFGHPVSPKERQTCQRVRCPASPSCAAALLTCSISQWFHVAAKYARISLSLETSVVYRADGPLPPPQCLHPKTPSSRTFTRPSSTRPRRTKRPSRRISPAHPHTSSSRNRL